MKSFKLTITETDEELFRLISVLLGLLIGLTVMINVSNLNYL